MRMFTLTNAGSIETAFRIRRTMAGALKDLTNDETEVSGSLDEGRTLPASVTLRTSSDWYQLSEWDGRIAPGQRKEITVTLLPDKVGWCCAALWQSTFLCASCCGSW